jgi:hypothetical protein
MARCHGVAAHDSGVGRWIPRAPGEVTAGCNRKWGQQHARLSRQDSPLRPGNGTHRHRPKIKLLKLVPQKFDFLTFEEYEWLLDAVKDDTERRTVFLLGAEAGLWRRWCSCKPSSFSMLGNRWATRRRPESESM